MATSPEVGSESTRPEVEPGLAQADAASQSVAPIHWLEPRPASDEGEPGDQLPQAEHAQQSDGADTRGTVGLPLNGDETPDRPEAHTEVAQAHETAHPAPEPVRSEQQLIPDESKPHDEPLADVQASPPTAQPPQDDPADQAPAFVAPLEAEPTPTRSDADAHLAREDAPSLDQGHAPNESTARSEPAAEHPPHGEDLGTSIATATPSAAPDTPTRDALEIDFGQAGNGREFIRSGWSYSERDFTWTLDERSDIEIADRLAEGDYVLRLTAGACIYRPGAERQRLTVRVAGEAVIETEITHGVPATIEVRIPGSLMSQPGPLHLSFDHPDAVRPCDVSANRDSRRLALSFHRMVLQRQSHE